MESTRNELLEQVVEHARIIKNTTELYDYFKMYDSPYYKHARGMLHAELFVLQNLCEKLDTALDGEEALE